MYSETSELLLRVGVWVGYLDRIRLFRFGNQNPLLYQHPIRFVLMAPIVYLMRVSGRPASEPIANRCR
jgi:hypothetical protein